MKMQAVVLIACGQFFSVQAFSSGTEWIVGAPGVSAPTSAAEQFPNLELAFKKLATLRAAPEKSTLSGGLTIRLLPGVHRLTAPLILTAESGGADSPLTIAGPADKSAIISGGRTLDKFSKVSDPRVLERLSPAARVNVVQFDLRAEGISEFGLPVRRGFWPGMESATGSLEVFFRGKPMTLARWPNEGYANLSTVAKGADAGRAFNLEGAHLDALSREPALMATGYWGEDWSSETIPVAAVDSKSGVFTLQSPGPQHGIKAKQRVFVQNALCELDNPGEWYLDRTSGMLYLWPPAAVGKGDVEVSVLPSLIIAKGAQNFRLAGMTLELARGDALAISGGRNAQVENLTIRNVGGRAANVEGFEVHLNNIDVYDSGEGGVYLWGGDRQALRPANLSVENSRFRRFNRLSRTYRPAVYLQGVGDRAIGNVISDGTHNAIMFFGNNHLIAFNEISQVALETGDVGAIYTARDWTARGTVVRNNYLHDIHGPGLHGSRGVYLDDQASGITVKGNLFSRVDRAIFVGGGRDNVIEDNLMVSSAPAIHVDARGLTWQRALTDDKQGVLRKWLRDIPIDSKPYREQYPNLAKILDDEPGAPKYNVIQRNIVIEGEQLDIIDGADRWLKGEALIKANEIKLRFDATAPGTHKPSDFAFQESAQPANKGFAPLPLAAMDCVSDSWRLRDAGKQADACNLK